MVVGWIPTIFRQTKYFGRRSAVYVAKDTSITYSIKNSDGNILTDENEILSRWREYFEGLLNPVKALTRDTHEVTHLGEGEVFTAAEVATAIKRLKFGKAFGEAEIRPEMLCYHMCFNFFGCDSVIVIDYLGELNKVNKLLTLSRALSML